MVKLAANAPLAGHLPVTIGSVEITEVVIGDAWLVAPFAGQKTRVSSVLKKALGVGLPPANRHVGTDPRIIWMAGGQWLVVADDLPDLAGTAAVTAQGDGLALARVAGAVAVDVLARLVPLDLRAGAFDKGHTARSLLGHMTASVSRVGNDAFEVMVMRSMAGTLVHDLTRAATGVAGR